MAQHSLAGLAPSDPRHGTRTGYGYHRCRCDRCRKVNADSKRVWHRKRAALFRQLLAEHQAADRR